MRAGAYRHGKQKLINTLAFVLSLSFAFLSGSKASAAPFKPGYPWESFDPAMVGRFQKVEDLIRFADSSLGKNHRQTLAYANLLDSTIRLRFYHSYSTYSPLQNWVAYLAGRWIWMDLGAIVIAEDIMKHPMAACSQQAIVLIECFKTTGIPYRPVHLRGHYAVEGRIGNDWYYFDPNLEPGIRNRMSLKQMIAKGTLDEAYRNKISTERFNSIFLKIEYGRYNEAVAWKATSFHVVTMILSFALPLIGLPMLILYLRRKWRSAKPMP